MTLCKQCRFESWCPNWMIFQVIWELQTSTNDTFFCFILNKPKKERKGSHTLNFDLKNSNYTITSSQRIISIVLENVSQAAMQQATVLVNGHARTSIRAHEHTPHSSYLSTHEHTHSTCTGTNIQKGTHFSVALRRHAADRWIRCGWVNTLHIYICLLSLLPSISLSRVISQHGAFSPLHQVECHDTHCGEAMCN